MGTAVIPLTLSFLDFPFLGVLAAFFFGVAALMFLLVSAVAWKVTQFSSIFYFFILATVFLLIVWLIVLLGTVKGVASGKIFLPAS